MTDFRNAYHFVPRRPETDADRKRPLEKNPALYGMGPNVADGHAAYAPGTSSGRLVCTITLECATVIGAARTKGTKTLPALVEPFLINKRPAIPASSLKGMISAIAESASRAPYRVLRNMRLTVAYTEDVSDDPKHKVFKSFRHHLGENGEKISKSDKSRPTNMGRSHDYFPEDLLPLAIKGKAHSRMWLHPVETMFGFVFEAETKKKKPSENDRRSQTEQVDKAAGKLRFSNATPCGVWSEKDLDAFFLKSGPDEFKSQNIPKDVRLTLLKEQGEPMKAPKRQKKHVDKYGPEPDYFKKLNSATPNFYFFEKEDPKAFIAKRAFAESDPSRYSPQGGKFYLHAHETTSQPWKSRSKASSDDGDDGLKRRTAARILQTGITFSFTIDFDNLSDMELEILCFALRPTEKFRHKIGIGKGLGLGSIKVDIDDLIVIDRAARYTAQAALLPDERANANGSGRDHAQTLALKQKNWLQEADKPALTALLAIGEAHNFSSDAKRTQIPVVWVPLTTDKIGNRTSPDAEDRSFQWFSQNDSRPEGKQKLKPIGEDGNIPTLRPLAPPKPRR